MPLEGIAVGRIIRFENEVSRLPCNDDELLLMIPFPPRLQLRTVLDRWGRDAAKDGGGEEGGTTKLKSLLSDPAMAAAFKSFAAQRQAMDMVTCWEAIEAYKCIPKQEDRVKEAQSLFARFVDPSSEASLSVDEDIVTAIQAKLKDTPGSRNIFDDLQHFTWQMLEFGVCVKFSLTEDYKKLQQVRVTTFILLPPPLPPLLLLLLFHFLFYSSAETSPLLSDGHRW